MAKVLQIKEENTKHDIELAATNTSKRSILKTFAAV